MINELKFVSDPISMHIWSSLHNYAYEEAIFAAERLFAETKNDESLYMLASCLYRMGRPKQVSRLLSLHGCSSSKSRFLLTKCFFDMSMLNEAENTLFGSKLSPKSLGDITADYGDQACYAFRLLGCIYKSQQKYSDAVKCFKECLTLNPLMWTAYENLCSIGEFIDADEVFKLNGTLGLLTPTFTVVGQNISAPKSPVNVKSERDRLGSRENVNPNSTLSDSTAMISLVSSNDDGDSEKFLNLVNGSQIVKSTYISQRVVPHSETNISNSNVHEDTGNIFTPVGLTVPIHTPNAPFLNNDDIQFKRDVSFPIGETSTPPTFGLLSMIPQSPMFACVPVFSRLDANTLFSSGQDNTQPFRMALHQSTVNRQQSTRQVIPSLQLPNVNQLQATILFNSTSISHAASSTTSVSHWRNKNSKASTPRLNASIGTTGGQPSPRILTAETAAVSVPPPWLVGSPISTPACSNTIQTPNNAFAIPKNVLLDLYGKMASPISNFPSTRLQTLQFGNAPMDIAESVDTTATQLSPISEGLSEPRTRAQKARAAASMTQRRSPRLSRASKPTEDILIPTCDETSIKDSLPTPRFLSTQPLPNRQIKEESVIEPIVPHLTTDTSKIACSVSTERMDPRNDSLLAYLTLLRRLGRSFSLLTQHDYKAAVTVLSQLPPYQLATGRTLTWAARAHVDAADYPKAQRIFNELRRLEPWQLYGMDLFSTVLWFQQADFELSQLTNDLLNLDRTTGEPWSAVGNCFSLQREHEVAIRFFRRALQVNPSDGYACTLLGHEYMAMDNLERAVSAFRHALRLDERNYSARFGLSNVYFKQELFGLADAHLVRALSLFPTSSLLLTHLGAIRARVGRLSDGPGSALDCLNKAVDINPNSPIARFHRACIFNSLGRYQDAINELERLILLTPREAMIYFMLGDAYQHLGNSPQARIYYSWSMELDPRGMHTNLRDIMANASVSATASGGTGVNQSSLASFSIDSADPRSAVPPGSSDGGRRRRARRGRYSRRGVPHRLFLTPSFRAGGSSFDVTRELAANEEDDEDDAEDDISGGLEPPTVDEMNLYEAFEDVEDDDDYNQDGGTETFYSDLNPTEQLQQHRGTTSPSLREDDETMEMGD